MALGCSTTSNPIDTSMEKERPMIRVDLPRLASDNVQHELNVDHP